MSHASDFPCPDDDKCLGNGNQETCIPFNTTAHQFPVHCPCTDENFLLLGGSYKGDMGRIGVAGGCREYTGAPYFAAMAALRLGADLAHIFCTADAASVIKTYSPELIVHPLVQESHSRVTSLCGPYGNSEFPCWQDSGENHSELAEQSCENVRKWFNRLDALVIGPGLGQDPLNSLCAKKILIAAKESKLPLVLDADSLYLITQELELIEGCHQAILTPNINELRRLGNKLEISTSQLTPENHEARENITIAIAQRLNGPILISKGAYDIITNGSFFARCTSESSNRRCGGQGDLLSGCLAVFAHWSKLAARDVLESPSLPFLLVGCYGSCFVTRRAAQLTFVEEGRSMLASDVINRIGRVLDC